MRGRSLLFAGWNTTGHWVGPSWDSLGYQTVCRGGGGHLRLWWLLPPPLPCARYGLSKMRRAHVLC